MVKPVAKNYNVTSGPALYLLASEIYVLVSQERKSGVGRLRDHRFLLKVENYDLRSTKWCLRIID